MKTSSRGGSATNSSIAAEAKKLTTLDGINKCHDMRGMR